MKLQKWIILITAEGWIQGGFQEQNVIKLKKIVPNGQMSQTLSQTSQSSPHHVLITVKPG